MTPLVRSAFREIARPRILSTLAIAEAAFVFVGASMPAPDAASSARLAERVGLMGAVLLLGGFAAASGSSLVAEEVRKGRAAAMLARPVPRWRWILARFGGLVLALFGASVVLGIVHGAAMSGILRKPEARDAVTSRRFVTPEASTHEDDAPTRRLRFRFPIDAQEQGIATLRGTLRLASPAILPEQQLPLRVHLDDATRQSDATVLVRPNAPFEIDAQCPIRSAAFDVAWPEGVSARVEDSAGISDLVLLLDATSRGGRVANAFALLFLASLAVAAFACAASALVSAPVALAVALLLMLLGFVPDAIPSSARFLTLRREPEITQTPDRTIREWAPTAMERAIVVASKPLPDLLELWPGDALDAGVDTPWSEIPARVARSWPQAGVALLFAMLVFSRRDL